MYQPPRPFEAVRLRSWQWFYANTTGLVGLLGSHMIDVGQWFMDDPVPVERGRARRHLHVEGRPRDQRHRRVRLRVSEGLDADVLVAPRIGAGVGLHGAVRQGRGRSTRGTGRCGGRQHAARGREGRGPARSRGLVDASLTQGGAPEHVANWIECMVSRKTAERAHRGRLLPRRRVLPRPRSGAYGPAHAVRPRGQAHLGGIAGTDGPRACGSGCRVPRAGLGSVPDGSVGSRFLVGSRSELGTLTAEPGTNLERGTLNPTRHPEPRLTSEGHQCCPPSGTPSSAPRASRSSTHPDGADRRQPVDSRLSGHQAHGLLPRSRSCGSSRT